MKSVSKRNLSSNGDFFSRLFCTCRNNPFLFYLIPFLLLLIPWVVVLAAGKAPSSDGYYSLHFLLNYSHGYVGRGFVGEVLSWFLDVVTLRTQQIVLMTFAFLLVVAASLCIGRALQKSADEPKKFRIVLALVLYLCLARFTVGTYYTDLKMDKILWCMGLLCILWSEHKVLHFFIPVLAVISMLINPVALLITFPMVIIVMIDRFQKRNSKVVDGALIVSVMLIGVGVILYGYVMQSKVGFPDMRSLIDYYYSRSDITISDQTLNEEWSEWLIEYFPASSRNLLQITYQYYFVGWGNGKKCLVSTIFFAIPVFSGVIAFWTRVVRAEEDKFRKFIFALCPLSLLTSVPAIILSWEAAKYYGCAMFAQVILMIYFASEKDSAIWSAIESAKQKIRENPLVSTAAFCYLAYVSLCIN